MKDKADIFTNEFWFTSEGFNSMQLLYIEGDLFKIVFNMYLVLYCLI